MFVCCLALGFGFTVDAGAGFVDLLFSLGLLVTIVIGCWLLLACLV